jgi:serine/threonine-protein kinase
MSPEQARGEELDARSDLFSFGVVLYEMATGHQAFTGNTLAVILDAILHKTPTSPVRLNPELPDQLGQIINKALEKDCKLRYHSASDLRTDLQRLKRDVDSGRRATLAKAETSRAQSLAVLPFANLSADKENEYFSDGLAEEIINALTRLPGLRVVARTSSFCFRGREADVREIGARLNVENILEGSVRKAGNRIRVTAQLVSAADGMHQWSERYDRELTDVFAIQDELCHSIIDRLRVELTAAGPLVKRYTENVEAYNLYLKGRYHLLNQLTPSGLPKAKECFERAIGMDSNYALAWSGLAEFYLILGQFGYMQPKEAYARGSQAAGKALELDPLLPEAHGMAGLFRAADYDWKGAERAFQRALALGPASASVWTYFDYWYLVPMRRLDEAVAASRKALELDPHYWPAHFFFGSACLQTGKLEDGMRALEAAAQLLEHTPLALMSLASARASTGRIGEVQKLLEELRDLARKAYVLPSIFAFMYMALGEIDRSFDWLEKAVDERDGLVNHLHVSPIFDQLRSHRRYAALLHKMNLEP